MATEKLIIELDAKTKRLDAKLKATDEKLDKLTKTTKKADKSFADLRKKGEDLANKGLLAVSGAAVATAASIGLMVTSLVNYSKELRISSQLSGIAADKLQLMAFATSTVGIGLEDLGDKSKDAREKIGDFLNTGGGGFMDFVDAMKLTKEEAAGVANEFKHLSGVEILQEMVTRMEDANVSAVQMSHALEGMASDTTKLIPLLIDGGREMKNLAQAAGDLVVPLTEDDMEKMKKLGESASLAKASIESLGQQIVISLADTFITAFDTAAHFYASLNEGTSAAITTELAALKIRRDALKEENAVRQDFADKSKKRIEDSMIPDNFKAKQLREHEEARGAAIVIEQAAIDELWKKTKKLNDEQGLLSFGVDVETGGLSKTPISVDDKEVNVSTGDEIQAIADRFKTEGDLLFEKLERELEIVGENNELKLSLEEEYLVNSVLLEEDAAGKKKKLKDDELKLSQKIAKTERSLASSNANALVSIASSLFGENDKLKKAAFVASKAISISDVFFNTQVAATKALADLGPIVGAPVAAGIEVNGGLRMAAIAATALGGMPSSGGGGISGGGGLPSQTEKDQEQFQPETSSLNVSEASDGGARLFQVDLPDGDEIGQAIANWMMKATEEGRI